MDRYDTAECVQCKNSPSNPIPSPTPILLFPFDLFFLTVPFFTSQLM